MFCYELLRSPNILALEESLLLFDFPLSGRVWSVHEAQFGIELIISLYL